ncbi:hypothetical protein [Rickettsia fournieri]|nr:hypothetical protein [Rickettsia fournieri]
MVGNKNCSRCIRREKTAIVDDNDCHNALDEYTTWYNNDYTVA